MDIKTTFTNFKNVLETNTDLVVWCNVNYSASPTIFTTLNPEDPPDENQCPYFFIRPDFRNVGKIKKPKEYKYYVSGCLYDTSSDAAINLLYFDYYTLAALGGVDLSGARLQDVAIDYYLYETYPFPQFDMILTIIDENYIGSSEFLI